MSRRDKHLEIIKKAVVDKFNCGKPKNWQNKDFEELSFKIKVETKILISKSTLKRIFGKNKTGESYYPQPATLEALQIFGGIKDPEAVLQNQKQKFQKSAIWSLLALVSLSFSLLLLASGPEDDKQTLFTELKLERIEGSSPSTVFFSYDIPVTEDSLFLHLGNGIDPFYLTPHRKKTSLYLRFPGVFHPYIAKRDKEILSASERVFVPSKGWQALGYYYLQPYSMRYYPIPMSYNSPNYAFHIDGKDLNRLGMDTSKIVVLRLDNFQKTSSDGDTFILKTKIKSSEFWPAIRCNSIYISVVGEYSKILFKTTNEGCSAHSEYRISEKAGYGTDELIKFCLDTREWHEVVIKNTNKHVEVYLNDELAFEDDYLESLGNIHGVSLVYHGSGYAEYLTLEDQQDNTIFSIQK
ncbi:hypothetical protein [Echinicola sp. 20G]|uniref:hypothetical protein n=1 Tax=Echinicola sp. 20G TaxID=2781961 RepID=UPI00191112E5|nr:hypothetical protein [Echinicola sp. 20G]